MSDINIDDDTYEKIMEDAHIRHRTYQNWVRGKATNQTINEKDQWEYWVLTSAYKAGVDSTNPVLNTYDGELGYGDIG
jgi:hypothetical protein